MKCQFVCGVGIPVLSFLMKLLFFCFNRLRQERDSATSMATKGWCIRRVQGCADVLKHPLASHNPQLSRYLLNLGTQRFVR